MGDLHALPVDGCSSILQLSVHSVHDALHEVKVSQVPVRTGMKAKLFDAVGDGFCSLVIAPGVIVIGADFVQPFVLDLVFHALHAIPPGK